MRKQPLSSEADNVASFQFIGNARADLTCEGAKFWQSGFCYVRGSSTKRAVLFKVQKFPASATSVERRESKALATFSAGLPSYVLCSHCFLQPNSTSPSAERWRRHDMPLQLEFHNLPKTGESLKLAPRISDPNPWHSPAQLWDFLRLLCCRTCASVYIRM